MRQFRIPEPFPGRDLWWYGLFHVLFSALVIALIVMLAVWLTNRARHHQHGHHAMGAPPMVPMPPPPGAAATDPALHEARMRYARGELSREDFLRINQDLGGWTPPPEGPSLAAP